MGKKPLEDIEISKKLKLHQILNKDESFTIFSSFLSRAGGARGMAALLSFVEVVQFKEQCCRRLDDVDPGTFRLHSKLAPSIPRSIIVFNEGYPLADDISAQSATESMGPLQQKKYEQ